MTIIKYLYFKNIEKIKYDSPKFINNIVISLFYRNFASLKMLLMLFLIHFFRKYGLPLLKYVKMFLNCYPLLKLYILFYFLSCNLQT
jgi:hypothetical protein